MGEADVDVKPNLNQLEQQDDNIVESDIKLKGDVVELDKNRTRKCWKMELDCSDRCLPIEVIEKILLPFPSKCIAQWRCVSKQWQALLSSPQFIQDHTQIIKTQALQVQSVSVLTDTSWMHLSLTSNNQVTASIAHHNLHLSNRTDLIGSCDGLVLVLDDAFRTYLINPTTRQTKEIPTVITRHPSYQRRFTLIHHLDGIGFDSVNNDYKVVCVSQFYNYEVEDTSHIVHIYSVGDGAWKSCKNLQNFFGYRFGVVRKQGVFVGRFIHWLIRRDTDGMGVIVAFDTVEEKLCQVPNATHESLERISPNYRYNLGVLAGCLCVSTITGTCTSVWVMTKYGIQESWTRIAKIARTETCWLVPLCLFGPKHLVLHQYLKAKKLVTYNLVEETVEDVDIPDDVRGGLDYITVPLAETLVSPYGMGRECQAAIA